MPLLGTISGHGVAVYDEHSSEVDYELSIYREGSLKSARGALGAPWKTLNAIFGARNAKLTLKNGGSVEFFIERHNVPDDFAEIVVSGPVPGF